MTRTLKMNNLKNENGYVLVVIIGILTILSLMAITFATLSRIETRATRNYTDSVKCEKVAKAGLEHAIYIIRQDKFGDDDVAYNNDNTDTNYDYYDPSGDASWPGNGIFDGTDYDNDKEGVSIPPEDSKWIYFPATDSSSDIRLPGNLRARYAVLITDDREARVNINVSGNKAGGGSHTSNEGWSTFEIDLSDLIQREVGNGTTIANLIINARHGSDSNPGNAGDDDPGKIPDPQNDEIDNDGDSSIDEAGEDTNEPNEFNSISPIGDDVPFGLLSEAEIMGTSSYESRLGEQFTTGGISPEDQGAFKGYLTTYSADTIVCPEYQLDGVGTSTTMLNINALVNNGVYTDIQKVERIMDALLAGGITGSSAKDIERHQLAVNIKDFIDSDDTVTIYNDGIDDYYGIERTPYINEVEAEVSNPVSGVFGKYIELFNPYDTDISLASWTITGTTMPPIPLSGIIGSQTYFVIADNVQAYESDFDYEGGGTAADLYDPNVNILTTNGETLTLSDADDKTVQKTHYGNALGAVTRTKQLNDPRPIPLTASASNPWEWSTGDETAGEENLASIFDPGDGSDGWSDATWKPSFLIANRRFSNKGYIGFIHKGSEWSSVRVGDTPSYPIDYLNLLEYITITDPSMDNIDNDGDSSKDSADTGSQTGDFDGPEYRIPGLINVNTAPTEVLASLPDGSGGTLGSTIATEISGGSKPYESIGDLIDKVDGANGITDTSATYKWDEEKRLRAISNLITTRSNVFTVYVTAQITDEGQTSVFAEKRILAIVDRSVDPIKIRYFRWITE